MARAEEGAVHRQAGPGARRAGGARGIFLYMGERPSRFPGRASAPACSGMRFVVSDSGRACMCHDGIDW